MSNRGSLPLASLRTKALYGVLAALLLLALSAPAATAKSASVKTSASVSTDGLVNTVTGTKTVLAVPFSTFQALAAGHMFATFQQPAGLTGFENTGPGNINLLVTFPINGGALVGNSNIGTITHAGGLTLVKTDDSFHPVKSLKSTDLTILNATTLQASAHALDGTPIIGDLGAPTAVADMSNVVRTVNADGSIKLVADYTLNAITAQVLNVYFDTTVFQAGLNMGHGTSTITTRGVL
jgi:hypothetical protein